MFPRRSPLRRPSGAPETLGGSDGEDGGEVDRAVDVGERLGGVADLLVDDRGRQERLVDVENHEVGHSGVEPLQHPGELCLGAAVHEPLVGQLDATGGAGV